MPSRLFTELDEKKREAIEQAALAEFADNGYSASSTNCIVKNAQISKGSLFQYFANKQELYFYILDGVTAEFTSHMTKQIGGLSGDLFERIIQYAQLEFAWYIQNPQKGKLIIRAFANSSELWAATQARYGSRGEELFGEVLQGTDAQTLRGEKRRVLNIIQWFLSGFNEQYIREAQTMGGDALPKIKQKYTQEIREYFQLLKMGLSTQ